MRSAKSLLENPYVYALWQLPFARAKLAPIHRHGGIGEARRVLDIGCGPGTNAKLFETAEYVGIDINPAYIARARRRHGGRFEVADVRTDEIPRGQGFDFILVNSLLHHLETEDVRRILARASKLLTDEGRVHVLDLVLPPVRSVARALARWDRGAHARPLDEWSDLFSESLELEVLEPYPLPRLGPTLWSMVYLRGRRRP